MLYNVPGRTSSNILADTTLKLASDCKNIFATKEASGNFEQIMRIIKYKPDNFMVISGDDLLALPVIASGGQGVISVIANAFPYEFSEMTRMALLGRLDAARRYHYKLTDVIEQIFADGSPAGIKEVLGIMQLCHADVRLPLVSVSPGIKEKLRNLVQKYKQDKLSAA
jgi:4-hydroxy-tetrahydrodipicolinate synthase